jgi:hypothetical protein
MMVPSDGRLVTFRGGAVFRLDVVARLLALEHRGARFVLLADGGFRVVPPDLLTADDTAFLRAHRDQARAVVRYQADDSHLFTDTSQARELRECPHAADRWEPQSR